MASTGVDRISGVDPSVAIKAPCKVASADTITLSGAQSIDGIAVSETIPKTRVLVFGQSNQIENGVYDVYETSWRRSDDFNGSRDVVDATLVSVDSGDLYGGKTFRVTSPNPILIGSSPITFEVTNTIDLIGNVITINSYFDIQFYPLQIGQVFYLKQHTSGGLGGGKFIGTSSVGLTANNGTVSTTATAGVYAVRQDLEKGVDVFMFGGQRGQDIRIPVLAAVDASPSTHDITSAYTYEPSWKIKIPYGNYLLSERVLITKNNIIIEGDGMFNTNIKSTSNAPGNPVQSEMIRFRGAYACGLKNLTLDGGLAFNHTVAPNYGCRIPLVLDQVAHFDMDGVNSCNYRTRGIQCIHVWESKFGEIRCFNGWGLTDLLGIAPGGLMFDGFSKEENFFPGSESNQVYIAKYAFSGVGRIVSWDSPCFNVIIGQLVAEGRTYSGYLPDHMDTSKIYLSGLSALCGIQHAWVYFHDQSVASNAILIQADNAGMGNYFDNFHVYQENASPGVNFSELTHMVYSTSAFPVRVDLHVQDIDTTTTMFQAGSSGSLITGNIFYRNSVARTLSNLMGATGITNFNGKVTMSTGAFGASVPVVYDFSSVGEPVSAIDGSGIYTEYKCRAWVKFNGTTGAIIGTAKNVSGVVRNSAGNYSVTFATAMPDADYAATATSNASATGGERAYVAGYNASNMNVVNGVGAGFADATVITCAVFR